MDDLYRLCNNQYHFMSVPTLINAFFAFSDILDFGYSFSCPFCEEKTGKKGQSTSVLFDGIVLPVSKTQT